MKRAVLFAVFLCSSLIVQAQYKPVEVSGKAIKALTEQWNAAHNERKASNFEKIYASQCKFYGQWLSLQECVKAKRKLFRQNKVFKQRIVSRDLILTAYPEKEVIKCEFTKEVTTHHGVENYEAALYIREFKTGYLIVGESDEITDQKLGITYDLGRKSTLIDIDDPNARKNYEKQNNAEFRDAVIGILVTLLVIILAAYGLISLYNRLKEKYTSKKQPTKNDHKSSPKVTFEDLLNNVHKSNSARQRVRSWSHTIEAADAEVVTDVKKPYRDLTNEEKGYAFERYIVPKFDPRFFTLKEWRGDKRVGWRFALSSLEPDLHFVFSFQGINKEFAVECKYRSSLLGNNQFDIVESQLQRYREYEKSKNIDVYLVLGLGGTPDAPSELFLVPLKDFESGEYLFLSAHRKSLDSNFFMGKETLILR